MDKSKNREIFNVTVIATVRNPLSKKAGTQIYAQNT